MHYRNTIGKKSGRQTGASANSEIGAAVVGGGVLLGLMGGDNG